MSPTIKYKTEPQELTPAAQYLLLKSGLVDMLSDDMALTLPAADFVEALKKVRLETIANSNCRSSVEFARTMMNANASMAESIHVEGWQYDNSELALFLNETEQVLPSTLPPKSDYCLTDRVYSGRD